MLQITMTKESQTKKQGTKTVFETNKTETKVIDKQHYKNILDAKKFMQNLGGSESHIKSYTCNGYCVVRIISTSPDKQMKSIYNFDFKWVENK